MKGAYGILAIIAVGALMATCASTVDASPTDDIGETFGVSYPPYTITTFTEDAKSLITNASEWSILFDCGLFEIMMNETFINDVINGRPVEIMKPMEMANTVMDSFKSGDYLINPAELVDSWMNFYFIVCLILIFVCVGIATLSALRHRRDNIKIKVKT